MCAHLGRVRHLVYLSGSRRLGVVLMRSCIGLCLYRRGAAHPSTDVLLWVPSVRGCAHPNRIRQGVHSSRSRPVRGCTYALLESGRSGTSTRRCTYHGRVREGCAHLNSRPPINPVTSSTSSLCFSRCPQRQSRVERLKVESGTPQSKSGPSANLSNS